MGRVMWPLRLLVVWTLGATLCWCRQRLPDLVKPTHYDVRLQPYLDPQLDGEKTFTVDGQVIIRLRVRNSTDVLRFHAHNVLINDITVKDYASRDLLPILPPSVDGDLQQLEVRMKAPLIEGREYVLSSRYIGQIRPGGRGIARASYIDKEDNVTRWVLYTSFESTHARQAFPCFDEPGFKAHFTLRIARRNTTTAVSNMPLKNSVPFYGMDGWVWDSFEETPMVPPYLLSLAVGAWVSINAPGQLPSRVYVIPGQERLATVLATALGPTLSVAADSAIGVGVPPGLLKLDCVVVPDPAMDWAVENWGLLTFGEIMVMLQEDYADAQATEEVYQTIGHEVAHLWFGNMATLRWWDNLWLKEGFASYFQYYIVDILKPEWELPKQFPVTVTEVALRQDVRGQRSALYSPADTPDDIEGRYDEVSYLKGSAFINMLESFLGEKLLLTGIQNFLLKHANDTSGVDLDDLFNAMGNVTSQLPVGKLLPEVMQPWVTQSGYPLITVSRRNETHLVLSQKQFMPGKEEKHHWWVPVTYTCALHGNNSQYFEGMVWLPPNADVTVSLGKKYCDWFIFNMGHKGYFRVSYSRNLNQWRELAAVLEKDPQAVPVEGRAQLLDDAFQLSAIGLLPYASSLRLAASFLSSETNPGPWIVAIRHFSDMLSKLRARPGVWQLFVRFLVRLATPPLRRVISVPSTAHSQRVLKCVLSSFACLQLHLCPESLNSDAEPISQHLLRLSKDPDLLEAVLCSVMRLPYHLQNSELQQLFNDMRSTDTSPFIREHAYNAIVCSESPHFIYKFLKAPLLPGENSNISYLGLTDSFEHVLQLPSSVIFSAIAKLADEFIHENPTMIPFFVSAMTNVAALKNETDLIREVAKAQPEDTSVKEALQQLEENEKWVAKNTLSIFQWLKKANSPKSIQRRKAGRARGGRYISLKKRTKPLRGIKRSYLSKKRRRISDEVLDMVHLE